MKPLINAAMVLFGAAIGLALAEGVLRASVPPQRYLDERTDSYWAALRSAAPRAAGEEADIVPDAELGWRMRPHFERDGVRHNSRGFRGAREYSPDGGPRILALGDSFTYGLGVPDESTFAAVLERLVGVEVINAGVNGYGIDQALLMWEIEGKRLKPTSVVLGYYVDDFFRNALSRREGPKPRFVYDAATDQYRLQRPGTDSLEERGARVVELGAWLVRRVRTKLGWLDEQELARHARISEHLLRSLHESIAQSGARLLVVVIGHSYDGLPEHRWIEQTIVRTCRENGIACLNLAAARRGVNTTALYGANGHFSEIGHRFAAERIAEALDRLCCITRFCSC